MAEMLTWWAMVVLAALLYGAYRLGLEDGRYQEREDENFKRLDKIIAELRRKG